MIMNELIPLIELSVLVSSCVALQSGMDMSWCPF